MPDADTFTITFQSAVLHVQEHFLAGATIFHIRFPDQRRPLVITRATDDARKHWWTSIPEGRQKEAQEIGPLIEAHIKSQN